MSLKREPPLSIYYNSLLSVSNISMCLILSAGNLNISCSSVATGDISKKEKHTTFEQSSNCEPLQIALQLILIKSGEHFHVCISIEKKKRTSPLSAGNFNPNY